MKILNNSVSKTTPDFRNASLFLVKPMPKDKIRANEYGMLEKAVSKQMKKKKKKNVEMVCYT